MNAKLLSAGLATLLLFASAASAQPNVAGEITLLTGRATAVGADGNIRNLAQGGRVFEGEMISTGPSSYLNVQFRDNSRILLRPNTRFEIEAFKYAGSPQSSLQAGLPNAPQPEESAFFRLVKGGFRAVTGAVGKRENSRYRVRTPVATIGIRGTDYEARMCAGDCLDIDPPPGDGLYAGVKTGEIEVANQTNVLTRTPGQYLFVPVDGSFVPLDTAPKALTADPMPNPENCN